MVAKLRDLCSAKLNQPLNHVLIQWYRSGADFISEHADKTIDVAKNSVIVNLSVGATRVMMLKTKNRDENERRLQRIDLVGFCCVRNNNIFESFIHRLRSLIIHCLCWDWRRINVGNTRLKWINEWIKINERTS
jgi:hypothetical protein